MAAQSFAEYCRWIDSHVPDEPLRIARGRYDSATSQALEAASKSPFWSEFLGMMRDLDDEYYKRSGGFKLFASTEAPFWVRKSFDSVLDKSFRKNVVLNDQWPEPPNGGWVDQSTWYQAMNDLIRTTVVVKYLDGVQFITDSIAKLCDVHSLVHKVDLEAREEGYYAAHLYVTMQATIPLPTWDTVQVPLRHEIQVTTQLQESIRKLTHDNYASRRSVVASPDQAKWQWDHTHPDFIPNYLGHILHYVEGMIMEIRARRDTD